MDKSLTEAKRVFEAEIEELIKVKDRLDENFSKMVDMIYESSGKVVITGIGKSGHIGKKISATLASTGTNSVFINAAEALHGDLGVIKKGDIVLAISNSGNSDQISNILPSVRRIGADIIAFTGNKISALGKEADLIINIAIDKEACPMGLAPMTSATVTLVMGDALAAALMQKRDFKPENYAVYHPGGSLGRRLLLKVKDLMHKNDELPKLTKDTHIDTVLMELTKKKMGAVCIAEDDRLIGIITEGDIRRALTHKEKFFDYTAEDVMTKNPVYVTPEIQAIEALEKMEARESQITVLPVVDNDKLVGIIRIHDLLNLR